MKKKTIVFLTIMAIFLIVMPVSAAGREPIGEQIYVGPDGDEIHFGAGEPFHIKHGWLGVLGNFVDDEPGDEGVQKLPFSGFDLEMDGDYLERDYILHEVTFDPAYREECATYGCLVKRSVFEFPEGLTGMHEFTGHWWIACKYWQEDCDDPMEILEAGTRTITVIFEE